MSFGVISRAVEDPRVALATLSYADLLNDREAPFFRGGAILAAILAFGQRSGQVVYGERPMAQSSSLRRKRKCAS